MPYFRRHHYNFFICSHFLFIPFYVLAYLHVNRDNSIGPFIYTALAIYLFDRLCRYLLRSHITKPESVEFQAGNVIRIRFPKHRVAEFFSSYKCGQHIYLNFPSLGFKYFFEWHPFSISSAPDETSLEVNIRGLGDFTNRLIERARANPAEMRNIWMRCNGPYGNLRLSHHRYPSIMLIGGGIGIAPLVSMLRDIYQLGNFPPTHKRPPSSVESVILIQILPSIEIFSWFARDLNAIFAASQNDESLPVFSCWIYITRGAKFSTPSIPPEFTSAIPPENFQFGKPDFDLAFDTLAKSVNDSAHLALACGPNAMIEMAWDAANKQSRKGSRIDFHREIFEF